MHPRIKRITGRVIKVLLHIINKLSEKCVTPKVSTLMSQVKFKMGTNYGPEIIEWSA